MLERLFCKRPQTYFRADEIKPFFESQGIDIETIGFPEMEFRNEIPMEKYIVSFQKVKAKLIRNEEDISVIIEGRYRAQAQINRMDEDGNYRPGEPIDYKFKIINGELNLKKIK